MLFVIISLIPTKVDETDILYFFLIPGNSLAAKEPNRYFRTGEKWVPSLPPKIKIRSGILPRQPPG